MNQQEMFQDALRTVAKLCAVAAMTAPKSGGQLFLKGSKPFIETVIVDDNATLHRLADWMREQGIRLQEAIWFRDADTAEKLDLVLFVGLAKWYPPVYDCGACGYGTCAEFLVATKQHHTSESVVMFVFGSVYPHSLDTFPYVAYLYAAPTGLVPCPTLSIVIGLALMLGGLDSRVWSSVLGAAGMFYGIFGALRLGVAIDFVLLIGALLVMLVVFMPKAHVQKHSLVH